MNVPEHVDPSINAMIRELQPKAVINNRGFDEGDFGTPERDWDSATTSKSRFDAPVEACQSVGYQSWGYRADEDYYSDAHLIRGIHNMLAKGANYLLNVGPQPDGTIPETAVAMLRRIGTWVESIRESFDGAEPVDLGIADNSIALTRRGNSLYVHLLRDPETSSVFLHPLATSPQGAILLNDRSELTTDIAALPRWHNQQTPAALRVRPIPVNDSAPYGRVLRLDFKTFPTAAKRAATGITR
jgi:alpha-L-fucosidase